MNQHNNYWQNQNQYQYNYNQYRQTPQPIALKHPPAAPAGLYQQLLGECIKFEEGEYSYEVALLSIGLPVVSLQPPCDPLVASLQPFGGLPMAPYNL